MSSFGSPGNSVNSEKNMKSAFGELKVVQPEAAILLHFPYNYNTDFVSDLSTASGTSTVTGQHLVIQSGAASSSSGATRSHHVLEYQPGLGAEIRFTALFTAGVVGNTQIVGIGDTGDGFFFGYNGTAFGILRRHGSSDTWTAATAFNHDKLDGTGASGLTIDTTKGNVYQIQYQWLGYGDIYFSIESPDTGDFVLVHTIKYPNQNVAPSLNNPSLPFYIQSVNAGNDTNITTKCCSVGAYIEGKSHLAGHTHQTISNSKTLTTELSILTIRCKALHASVANRVVALPFNVNLNNDGNQSLLVNLWLNTTLGGTPTYTDIDTITSVVDYDTAGTTVTGGTKVSSFILQKNTSMCIDMEAWSIDLHPGETLTITGTSAASNVATAIVSWKELFH